MSEENNIKIGSVISYDWLDIAYISLNSIKQNKKPETKIDYYLFIQYDFLHDEYYCKKYLDELIDDTFQIHYLDANLYITDITIQGKFCPIVFIRCLFPTIFKDFDKILHLDIDVFCLKEGIEELWNMPLDDFYVRAATDVLISFDPNNCSDYYNTQTEIYFNAGVMLMNLKKMREDGLDKVFVEWGKNWNFYIIRCIFYDQTLLNYFCRGHVGRISPIWNNAIFAADIETQKYFNYNLSLYRYYDLDSLTDTVFIHFLSRFKPWKKDEIVRGKERYPYINEMMNLWNELVSKYGKKRKR